MVNKDEVTEWLRCWTAYPMGSARKGSNPILVDKHFSLNILLDAYKNEYSSQLVGFKPTLLEGI